MVGMLTPLATIIPPNGMNLFNNDGALCIRKKYLLKYYGCIVDPELPTNSSKGTWIAKFSTRLIAISLIKVDKTL